jgi:outer membrane protein assembly factor BamB
MVSLELKETVSPDLVQCELLEMVHRGNWGEVRDLCERVRFWTGLGRDEGKPSSRYERILRHLKWAEGLAARHLPDEEGGALEPMPLALKHPLEAEYSKEGYNTIAEFDEALAGGAFEDACRIITASNRSAAIGLLPDARDSDLLVSLQAAVALAMRDHPGLRDVMEERFGDLGRLRVRQAMTRGDAPGVRSATVQFYGTTAAVEALIWLGDRGLAAGQLSRAVGSYLHASRHVAQVDHEDVAARLRLVGALEGKNVGAPVVRPIRMGTRSVTARDFEALVSRLREEREHSQEPGPFSVRPEDGGAPESGRYQTESVASFKVRDITRPSGLDNPRVDWVSAQLGVSLADDLVLVSERTQVHAHELSTGKRKWVQQGAGKRGQAQQWPLVSMRPLIVGSRAFCRFLKKNGPSLDCLDVRSGEVLWSAKGQDHVASDPMWVENRVVAVTATSQRDYVIELRLTAFDPISGEVVSETPLSRFRDAWNKQIPCRATSRLDRIVIAAGGSVLCTDSSGRMQWVRRQTWLPDGKRGRPEAEEAPSPLVVGGRVYVTQPGVPAFECLDLETGRLLWREFLPDATGVVGVVDEVLIMTLRDGLLGLDAGDGHRVWKRELDGMEAVRLGETRPELFALCSVTLDLQRGRRSPLLVWLDPRTGRETDSWPLGADGPLRQENLALGPFASDGDRVTFVAGRLGDRARSLFRLRRQGPSPAPSATTRRELDVWTDHVTGDEVLGRAARALFPAWTLVASPSNKAGGIVDETGGVKNVLVTHASKSRPVRFARSVDVPESGGAHVRLKVGRGDGDRWTLRVRVGGENLVDELIDETSAPLGWKEVDVDLGAYSGERVWLMVSQHVEKGRNGAACWKRIEVTQ